MHLTLEGCIHSSLVASRLALASALEEAAVSVLEEAEAAPDEAVLLWLDEPDAELLWEELPDVLDAAELLDAVELLWELLPEALDAVELLCEELLELLCEPLPEAEALLLCEVLELPEDAVPLEDDAAGFSSLEELLLSELEEDVLPDEPEEALELLLVLLDELDVLLGAALLTVTSTLLLVTVQSL